MSRYVISSPSIPYFFHDARFGRPCTIYICGLLPHHSTENVSINLANTYDFPSIAVPFHLSIRPTERHLVRNSWTHAGGWEREERHMPNGFPFIAGGDFNLMIRVKYDCISVAVNGKQCFEYSHRQSATKIDMLQIHGNVLISSISYEFY